LKEVNIETHSLNQKGFDKYEDPSPISQEQDDEPTEEEDEQDRRFALWLDPFEPVIKLLLFF
jgi:hypothetical protein